MTASPDEPRVAVVSGGSRGLGLRLVERLLDQDWAVATFSRTSATVIDGLTERYPARFHWAAADLSESDSLRSFVTGVRERFGRIDMLVNNAGVLHQELLLTLSPAKIGTLISANLVAPIVLAQACARVMSRHGNGGVVVNVSSVNAVRGYRGVSVYSAAKAGLEGFSRSLARELGALDIRVNTVVPGFFDSDMTAGVTSENRERIQRRTPLRRLADVDEVADAVLFLGSPAASFITGQTLVVDGGITC